MRKITDEEFKKLNHATILWCDNCNSKFLLDSKDLEGAYIELMWHKRGFCVE